jgi:hypothetical protein
MKSESSDRDYEPLDTALARLGSGGADLVNGMTNHAPMAAEALCALGRPDAVLPWVERYRPQILPRLPARERIDPTHWRATLSREDRFADWSAFFANELARTPWRDALDRWVGRLAPGICAAATHGVIRVGHAARALGAAETDLRRAELADALASWASTYQELPTAPHTSAARFAPRDALARVPVVPLAERRFKGTIVSSLEGLKDFPDFAPAIGLLDTRGNLDDLVAELARVFAGVLVENARDTLTTLVFVHGVTSVAALGNLLPHVEPATARAALPWAWQSAAALYATFAAADVARARADLDSTPVDAKTLVDAAISNGDEHAIKLAEACLGWNARAPAPEFGAAIRRALAILPAA